MNTGDGDVELLSRAILNEAQAEVAELKADARSKADSVRERAQAEADRQRKAILERAEDEAGRLRSQAIATTQLKSRSSELEHREKLLDRVFQAAKKSIQAAPERKDYEALTLQLTREGIRELKAPEVKIRADKVTAKLLTPAVLEQMGKELQVRLSLDEPLERGVGVILQTPDGHLQFDNTLGTRLSRLQATLRAAVFGILMGESK